MEFPPATWSRGGRARVADSHALGLVSSTPDRFQGQENARHGGSRSARYDERVGAADAVEMWKARQDDTMISVNTSSANDSDDITVVMGTLPSWELKPGEFSMGP